MPVLTVNPDALGLPETALAAEDGFTGEAVQVDNNRLVLHVKAKNYRLCRIFLR